MHYSIHYGDIATKYIIYHIVIINFKLITFLILLVFRVKFNVIVLICYEIEHE